MFNAVSRIHENLDRLNYNEYKRFGVDYYSNAKQIYENLIKDVDKYTDLTLNIIKETEHKIKLYKITNDNIGMLQNIFENKTTNILQSFKSILTNNNINVLYEENHLKSVNVYMKYLNSAWLKREISKPYYHLLQTILKEKYTGDANRVTEYLDRYGYVDKRRALVC